MISFYDLPGLNLVFYMINKYLQEEKIIGIGGFRQLMEIIIGFIFFKCV